MLPIDGTARLTGYGTLALRTGGSELKSQLYPGYAAPEQYSAAEFSGRYTDVYALAAVCYKMVTGQTPVAAPQRKVRDSLESAHSLEAGVPTWFSQVLACALRLDPARRMQTVPELMSALTDPNVANAMFERGDNQISTRKIMAVSLVVIFILAVLLFWSLLGSRLQLRGDRDHPRPGGQALPDRDQGQRPLRGLPHRNDRAELLRGRSGRRHQPGPAGGHAEDRGKPDHPAGGKQGAEPGGNARHPGLYPGQRH